MLCQPLLHATSASLSLCHSATCHHFLGFFRRDGTCLCSFVSPAPSLTLSPLQLLSFSLALPLDHCFALTPKSLSTSVIIPLRPLLPTVSSILCSLSVRWALSRLSRLPPQPYSLCSISQSRSELSLAQGVLPRKQLQLQLPSASTSSAVLACPLSPAGPASTSPCHFNSHVQTRITSSHKHNLRYRSVLAPSSPLPFSSSLPFIFNPALHHSLRNSIAPRRRKALPGRRAVRKRAAQAR